MTHMIADRFERADGQWTDLATGARVRLHIAAAGSVAEQLTWSERCEAQANLRHPLMNALIDFGTVDGERTFEAYEVRGAVALAGVAAQTLITHAVRFLDAHAIALTRPLADFALRSIVAGPAPRGRPVGVVLQRRAAYEAIVDALEAGGPAGPCGIHVSGPPHSGLRTLRTLAARAARLRGYIPVGGRVVRHRRDLASALAGRHLCILEEDGGAAGREDRGDAIAAFIARLGPCRGRRHLVLSFTRTAERDATVLEIDRLGTTAMSMMVFADRQCGPDAAQIFEAIKCADGRPGLVLQSLGACYDRPRGRPVLRLLRETAPAYAAPAAMARTPARAGGVRRISNALMRAAPRAATLAARGRHAAATRTLARAVRVLTARGRSLDAARCALALGRIALDRGRTHAAIQAFEQARDMAADALVTLEATIGLGAAWMAEGRLVDAEGALRTALLGANRQGVPDLCGAAASILSDCLRIQGRLDEAAAIANTQTGGKATSALRAAAAKIYLASGEIPRAVDAARQSVELAAATDSARLGIRAHAVLAEALSAAGGREDATRHAHRALALARAARLPIEVLRLRALVCAVSGVRSGAVQRLVALERGQVPVLHLCEMRIALARAAGQPIDAQTEAFLRATGATGLACPGGRPGTVAELEELIVLAQNAQTDTEALQRVCDTLRERLRALTVLIVSEQPEQRILAQTGKPWSGDATVMRRALASGVGVAPSSSIEPAEAAEPIRYGSDIIAALACRWAAGSTIDRDRSSSLLRVGALASAAPVRAILDRAAPHSELTTGEVLGDSAVARGLRDAVARAARAPFPVLIEGESGSGKELVARAIHRLGARRDRKFCPVNCAALTDDLLEAELFGHARGAFTGAVGERPGLFEEADGGTLFLDEIGELSARAQAKLLRVLQDGEVRRVGENVPRRVDVRIVAATNRRLAQEADAGRFRADLRFRLDVVRIDVPPLRERAADVPALALHFWADAAARVSSRATLAPDVLAALSRYDWPGNVRELQNVIAWMAVHSPRRGRISVADLPAHIAHASAPCAGTFEAARAEFERRFVRAALAAANGHRAAAAAALGLSRQGLSKMLKRLQI